jgi:phosphotransferase system HPr-like phosphotransfer protein
MAEGGIVTGPTLALIGEAGPEAVVPLDRMNMNKGTTNITVNVQGADPQQVVNALERYVRQNGALPSALL